MTLKEYLRQNQVDPVVFALQVGISVSTIYRYLRGQKCHTNTAYRIEKATKGLVTVEEMTGEKQ